MTLLDLFSDIGCMALGLERAGMRIVGLCDNDPFKRCVLARHWPDVPILGDITIAEFPAADFIAGGLADEADGTASALRQLLALGNYILDSRAVSG